MGGITTCSPGRQAATDVLLRGHIVPRPHDKSLCYAGGDKRIVVVDRHVSLPELHRHLSRTLLNGQRFSLRYQLPCEELDSLVSIASDEDLETMVQEYDRITPLRARLRFFLFPEKPETAASTGCLLTDAKSEQWFIDAINDSGLVSRGYSDSAIDVVGMVELDGISKNDSSQNGHVSAQSNQMPNSPSVESGVSSPSTAHLPPIKVGAEEGYTCASSNDQMFQLEEQFQQQMNVAPNLTTAGYIMPSPDSVACIASSASSWKQITYQDAIIDPAIASNVMDPSSRGSDASSGPAPTTVPPTCHTLYSASNSRACGGLVLLSDIRFAITASGPTASRVSLACYSSSASALNLAVQSNTADAISVAPNRPPNVTIIPPICTLYGPAAATAVVQVPVNQILSQVAPPASVNYTLDYTHPVALTHDQLYYTPIPSQYQTMTPTSTVLIPQAASQLPGENTMQQIVTSQPL